jgi:hypothetical protein
MRRAMFLTALFAAALALAATAAAANHTTVTETNHIHGAFTEPEFSQNPCNGATITSFQAYGNVVQHQTYFLENGEVTEVWATFTETGKVTIIDATGVTYAGRFTVWGNYNLNERNTNETFTLTIRVSGSDGSTIIAHEAEHFGMNANGDVTAVFDKMSLTCG